MSESARDSRAKQAHAATVLAVAERLLTELQARPADRVRKRDLYLLQTSFLARLTAALLLEPDFPALPEGFERRLDRERARRAARQLAASRGAWYRSFSKQAGELAPRDRTGSSKQEIDHRFAAQTAATLVDLRFARLDLPISPTAFRSAPVC